MLIKYENYKLKQGMQYPFVDNYYSEIIYNSEEPNDYIFNIVEPTKILTKTINQILIEGHLDQFNKQAVLNLFTDPVYRFIYDEEQGKYLMTILFTPAEKVNFSQQFQSILIKQTFAVAKGDYDNDPSRQYISLEAPFKMNIDEAHSDLVLQTFWIYPIIINAN